MNSSFKQYFATGLHYAANQRKVFAATVMVCATTVLVAGLPPASWDWPVNGQLWVKCIVATNAGGQVSQVLAVDTDGSTLGLLPAQLALRCRPGSTKWADAQAWDIPVMRFGNWRFQVVDSQGTVLADSSATETLRVPVTNLWTTILPNGPSEAGVAVNVLPLTMATVATGPAELKPLLDDFLAVHPVSLSVTGEVKFHVLLPPGVAVQVAQTTIVESLIVEAGASLQTATGKLVTVRTLLDNHGTIAGVVEPQVDWLETSLNANGAVDHTARTDARMRNWYDNRELVRSPSLTYSTLLQVSSAQLPPMVDDKPDRWLRRILDLQSGQPVSAEQQPAIMLMAGQFVGDMPGTYWARWGRYARMPESETDPARLRLDPDTRFLTRAITNLQVYGQFVDSTVPTRFLGTLESQGVIEVENPLEIRGALVNHGDLHIRRALIALADNPKDNHYETGWLRLQGPALSVLGGHVLLEHASASLEFGDQTKAVAENLQITGQGTVNLRFLDGNVRLGQSGDSFTLLGELDYGQMQIGPAVQIQLTEGGFYNGGTLDITGAGTRLGSPGWLGANNHDMRTTISGRGKLQVRDGALLELVAGYHQPDYWRRWSVVVENDLLVGADGTLHTAPYTGVGGSSDSPVEIRGTLINQGQMNLDRTLWVSGFMESTGRIQVAGAELILQGGHTNRLGGTLSLAQANLRTTAGTTIMADGLQVSGTGTFDTSLCVGTVTLSGSNSAFTLTPTIGADARLLVGDGIRCHVPEAGLTNNGLIDLSGAGTTLWTPNWLGAANHDMRTAIYGRGTLQVRDGAVLEFTSGYHQPDYWRRWSVVVENDVVVGSGGTLHTVPYAGFAGSSDSPVEIHGTLVNQGRLILDRTLLVSGNIQNSGRMEVNAPLTTTNRLVNRGELVLNAPLTSPDIVSEGGSMRVSQLTIGPGQMFSGDVTITGDLLNQGLLSPGNPCGLIEVTGGYHQTGSLLAEISRVAGQKYDRLIADGAIQVGGQLQIQVRPDASFQVGAVFDIIQGASVAGVFDTVLLPSENEAPIFALSYGTNYVRLTALQQIPPVPPAITHPPTNQMVTAGMPVTFSVSASGSPPLFYQWRMNGTNLAHATNDTLVISNVQASQVGGYTVVVTNHYGSTTSDVVMLTLTAPVILLHPQSLVRHIGQPAALEVQAVGDRPLSYRWTKNGVPVAGASNAVYAIHSVSVSQAGKYQVIVTNVMGSATSALAILTVDGVKPSLTILKPLPNARVSNDTVLVTGKVADTGGPLAGVYYQVNNAPWQTAGGTTNWQTTVTNLLAGTNLIRVYAKDTAENYSLTNTLKVNYVVTNLLLVLNGGTGLGKVTPYTNSLLEVGKNYSLTAAPLTGSLFSNWVCGGVVLTNKAVLQYTLRSNTTLVANFVTNAYLSRKGDYAGLFCPSTDVSMADWTNSGAVKLTVTDKGTFTGQLTYQGKGYPLSGALGLGGMTNLVILRGKDPALQVGLSLELSAGGGITGGVNQSTNWVSALWADLVWKKAVKTNYVVTVASEPDGTQIGTLSLAVQPSGAVTLTGSLTNNTKLMGSLPLTTKNRVVMYQTLYSGNGMWLGYMSLTGTNGGVAHWQKVGNPQGFSVNTRLTLR